MAIQTTEEFKSAGSTSYTTAIEKLKDTDLKVRIGGALQTYVTSNPSTGEYTVTNNPTTIVLPAAASAEVHIYRETDVDTAAAVFQPGSSIKAADLNAMHDMARMGLAEARNKIITADIKDGQVTSAKIEDGTIVNADINASADIANTKIADGLLKSGITVNSANIVDGSIVDADVNTSANIQGSKLADDSVGLTKLGSGALPTDITVSRDNIVNGTIQSADIETGTLDGRYYTETELDAGQLDTRYYTETELNPNASAGQNVLDARYFTETEAEAAFLRQDSSETIASGVTWSGTDSKVATTAAIDLRIIDLIDDVGGFVPIANETSFPTANPDVNNGAGTIVSVKTASTTLTPSGTTVTIANGAGSGNTVTITGVPSAIPSGYGFLIETTTTLHTYTFHRLTPKATEVSTVAANATAIAAAGNNVTDINNFYDLYQISTSAPSNRADSTNLQLGDLWFDSSSNKVMMVYDASAGDGFSPITPNQSDLVNIGIVAGQLIFSEDLGLITNAVNTGSGNNSINTVAASIADVNRYANEYKIANSSPDSPSAGDLWFDTVNNTLKNYNGTTWAGITSNSGILNVVDDTTPALGGHLDCNDKNLTEVGTVSGNNLQLDFGTL